MRSLVEFCIFTVLLGVFLYLGKAVINKNSSQSPLIAQTIDDAQKKSREIQVNQRQPASIPPPTIKQDIPTIHFSCSKKNKLSLSHRKLVKKRFLRIVGKDCGKNVKVTHSHKFPAQVFWKNKEQFSTDLIRLNPGDNSIHIETQSYKKTLQVSNSL